jgi:hypothetical protein
MGGRVRRWWGALHASHPLGGCNACNGRYPLQAFQMQRLQRLVSHAGAAALRDECYARRVRRVWGLGGGNDQWDAG